MANKEEMPDQTPDDDRDDKGPLKPGPGTESFKLASFWKNQVDQLDKAYERWHKRGNTVLKRYRDERNKLNEEGQRKMNLLWSNIQVMKPAIYSRCPTPIVDRKFLDHDPKGRISSMILERGLINEQVNGYHSSVTSAVYDRLLPGRGVVWVRYEPTFGESDSLPSMNPTGIEDELEKIGEETGDKKLQADVDEQLEESGSSVVAEKVVYDYVDWHDYYEFPAKARVKAEVQAIGKKVFISRKEAIEWFGEKIGKALKPDTSLLADTSNRSTGYSDTAIFRDINERSIVIYEIWDKASKRVYWLSKGYEYLCKVEDDPLELNEFFPARTLDATLTNDSRIPVPDYWEWQDQAIQIDELTARIAALSKACKIAGVYDASQPAINRIFNESVENKLIPVESWAMFAEKGGLAGTIVFIPLKEIQECIRSLQEVRQSCMQDLDQITGLSDVIRGTTDSRETLGGIKLKNNNAGTRLSDNQQSVAEFCRDLIQLGAEVMCKHFSDDTLIESSCILQDEELQPDTVMRDFFASQDGQQLLLQQAMQGQPSQQQPQTPGQPGQTPSPPQTGAPNPAASQPPPSQAQSNVVPIRPGMPPAQPSVGPQGAPPQQPAGAPGATPPQPTPHPLVPPTPPPVPDPQTLIMQKVQEAIELLRKDVNRGYRIDIEVDSTIFGDKEADRESATEFITAVGQFIGSMEAIGATLPEGAPLLAKLLQWGVRKYRTGRDLESEVDSFAIAMQKKAKMAAANPQPNPEQQKAQMEVQKTQMEIQAQRENDQRDGQRQTMEFQHKSALEQQKMQHEGAKMQGEMQMEKERHAMEREKMTMEMQIAREKHHMELQKMQAEAHQMMQEGAMAQQQMHQEGQLKQQEVGLKQQDMHMKHQEHQQSMQQSQQEHQQAIHQTHQEGQLAEKSHQLEQKSLANKARHEEKSHGLKMEQHKAKQQQAKQKAKGAK